MSSPPEASSPPPTPGEPSTLPIDDEDDAADIPLTMAASVVLTSLPRDAARALEGAGALGVEKVTIRLQPVGSAPHLNRRVFKLGASSRFEVIVKFLRRNLGLSEAQGVHCYVNSVFAPAPDEGVGNLWRCFKTKDELVVAYSITPAFG